MKEIFLVNFIIFFNIIMIVTGHEKYCEISQNHIACRNSGQFSPACPEDAVIVELGAAEQSILVNAHNEVRNRLAGGLVPGFSSAKAMHKVSWDSELAMLAELNVKQCKMNHDRCRSTQAFPYAGQNLHWSGTTGKIPDISTSLNHAVTAWFNEYKEASQADINVCCGGDAFHNIGHFLQLAQDKVVRIGCAVSRYTAKYKSILIACNYSLTNFDGRPVYESGAPGSGCSAGLDSIYNNLCL